MKNKLLVFSSLCLVLTACGRDGRPSVDNTGRNVRDRSAQAITPGNQSESEVDRKITQRIRQAVIEDNSLSMNAKNIKIMTINGVVTLRGVVNDEREKSEIASKARAVNGVRTVDDQIEITRGDMRSNDAARTTVRGGY